MATFVLAGPPCSGKSSLAWRLAQPADVVLDFDRICQELGSATRHDHPPALREAAEQEMQRRMWRLRFHKADAYVIRWAPRPGQRAGYAKRLGATVWLLNPGAEECIRRAGLDDRPEHTVGEIHKWYRLFWPSPVDWPPPVLRATSAGPATSRQW
jgi:predicted kinase